MAELVDDAPSSTTKHDDPAEAAGLPQGDNVFGRSVTINRPRLELFTYWRQFPNLANFMDNVESIEAIDDRRSRWVVKAPAGRTVEWVARVTEEEKGRLIAWETEEGADVPNSGRVTFEDATGRRGTRVTATLAYDPPAGFIGKTIAKIFQREPLIQARRDLRRFKQLMETGEIATSSRTHAQWNEEKA